MITNRNTRNWQVSLKDPSVILEDKEDIAQSVYVILSTIKGSDPLRVDFGSDVPLYLDKPANSSYPELIYKISTALARWEKRIKVNRCSMAEKSPGHRTIFIDATVISSGADISVSVNI